MKRLFSLTDCTGLNTGCTQYMYRADCTGMYRTEVKTIQTVNYYHNIKYPTLLIHVGISRLAENRIVTHISDNNKAASTYFTLLTPTDD